MSDHEVTVSGHALLGERLEMSPVTIVVKSGVITHIEYESHPPDLWICPAFFNAHTHLGDTIAMDINCAGQDLVSLVTPPEGLKHRILANTPHADLVSGMRSSVRVMVRKRTAGCADFRESGEPGVRALQEAARGCLPGLLIFGREGGEEVAGGLGISSDTGCGRSGNPCGECPPKWKTCCIPCRGKRSRRYGYGPVVRSRSSHPLYACDK